jgi:hypothetical protein|tara:strand:- start:3135 stop:3251 length:117 start_codon:yes stop_codon:yes gene_type:complete
VSSALDLKNPVIAKMKNKQCGLNEFLVRLIAGNITKKN